MLRSLILILISAGLIVLVVRATRPPLRPDPLANAQQEVVDSGDLAELLEPIRARHGLPALAGAIVANGQVHAIGAVGVRRAGGEERITIHDRFHLGSCTKAMTATLIAILVDDETLSWSTTVGETFVDVPMHDSWKQVSIEQLLHHRGGAPADLNADGLWERLWRFDGTPRASRMELVRGVLRSPAATVGRYVYSNAGYAIAGAMAECETDTSWEDLMQSRIFDPLQMASAGFGAPGTPDAVDQPRGHGANGLPREPGPGADNPPAIGPGGTVHASLADWGKFIALHLENADADDENALLSAENRARLHTPANGPGERYAMGWIVTERAWARVDERSAGVALTHAGSNTMWYAVAWMAPEREFAVLIATNQAGLRAERACDEAASAMIQHHLACLAAHKQQ